MCYVGKLVWEEIVADILKEFGDVLDIEKKPITLDGSRSDSKGMKSLRKRLKMAAEKIKVGRFIEYHAKIKQLMYTNMTYGYKLSP